MSISELQQVLKQLKAANVDNAHMSLMDMMETLEDQYTQIKDTVEVTLLAKQEELKELQRQVELTEAKAREMSNEYDSLVEYTRVYQDEEGQQAELYEKELILQQELQREAEELENELAELMETEEMEIEPNQTQLRLGLYRGLGLEAKFKDNQVEKLNIKSASGSDIRTISIKDTSAATINNVWEFLN